MVSVCHGVVYGSNSLQTEGSIALGLYTTPSYPSLTAGNLSVGGRALPDSNPLPFHKSTQLSHGCWIAQVWDLPQPEEHLNFAKQAKGLVSWETPQRREE